MKTMTALMLTLALAGAAWAAESEAPKNEEQKTLYALGVWMAQKVAPFNLTADELKTVEEGLSDVVVGGKPKIDMQAYGPKLQELAVKRAAEGAKKQKDAAKPFIEEALKEKGAEKGKDGLIYIPVKKGSGANPKASDIVKVNYKGTLTDGTVFDASEKHGGPATFPLNQVIPCWTEGVQKMKVGGKAKLVCPSDLAYGDAGQPPTIAGGATLVFEVELVSIEKSGEAEKPAKKEAKAAKKGEKGRDLAAEVAKSAGAQKSASGLVYLSLKEGAGASPKASDVVKVNYAGTLTDGTEFDSSYKRGEPATFPLNGVIPCWTEGVQKMKVGGKAKLVCPASIAYGDRGAPPAIPGGATLVFEVELLDIVGAGK